MWSDGEAVSTPSSGSMVALPFDYSIAAWLSRADRDGSLAGILKPDLTPPERTVAHVEGWILGVA